MKTALIVGYDVLSPYGIGVEALWDGLLSGQTAILACPDFRADTFRSGRAARCALSPDPGGGRSRVVRMLADLLSARPAQAPADAALLVATTTGAIDRLERMVLAGVDPEEGMLPALLPEIGALTGVKGPAAIISAACASSTAALTRALMMIRNDAAEAVLVVAVDGLSEFLFSGFSALMALDEQVARPFDRDRSGLSLGEAAAWFLVMSTERAMRDGYPVRGFLTGAAMTNDANHMTGPSRDGAGLARAIRRALDDGRTPPDAIALVAAHGTGTRYNDAMEMKALSTVFERPRPTFSVKGGTGHTMGSAGLLQAAMALEALRRGAAPPTLGACCVDDDARGWVSPKPQALEGTMGLVVNAGFGGINAAVVIDGGRPTDEPIC